MLDVFSSVTGCPAARDAVILGAPAGSTPITRTPGRMPLMAAATPEMQTAAADRHVHGGDVRTLFDDLQPGRAGARNDPRMIERRHHRQTRAR